MCVRVCGFVCILPPSLSHSIFFSPFPPPSERQADHTVKCKSSRDVWAWAQTCLDVLLHNLVARHSSGFLRLFPARERQAPADWRRSKKGHTVAASVKVVLVICRSPKKGREKRRRGEEEKRRRGRRSERCTLRIETICCASSVHPLQHRRLIPHTRHFRGTRGRAACATCAGTASSSGSRMKNR